eukprot:COSAG05_NODE_74_length_21769_cov_194.316290_33_plen_256_part_00
MKPPLPLRSPAQRHWEAVLRQKQRAPPRLAKDATPLGCATTPWSRGPWRHAGIILGPTGSGKTSYGRHAQQFGFCGREAHHFDFGEQLRHVVDQHSPTPSGLSKGHVRKVRSVLETGALLEDDDEDIVRIIVQEFVNQQDCPAEAILLLNGIPRHTGQASLVASLVDVRWVVNLQCDMETVCARIAMGSGTDRAGRVDDSAQLITKKLATFKERTQPLLQHYAESGALIISVDVDVDTQPADIRRAVDGALPVAY